VNLDEQFSIVDRAIDRVNIAWRALDAAAEDLDVCGFSSASRAARDALVPVYHVATLLEISG
jgi:hypothetical protein